MLSTLIAEESVLTRASGMTSRRWSAPNTCDTRLRVASVSKTFTAVAVLPPVERGQVRLDDALVGFVNEHTPQLDPRGPSPVWRVVPRPGYAGHQRARQAVSPNAASGGRTAVTHGTHQSHQRRS
ncbi:serine hydrolase [Streptomyces asiaticus]